MTIAGCWALYLIGRSIDPLRALIGLKRRARTINVPHPVAPKATTA
jgi:hypothetical protein